MTVNQDSPSDKKLFQESKEKTLDLLTDLSKDIEYLFGNGSKSSPAYKLFHQENIKNIKKMYSIIINDLNHVNDISYFEYIKSFCLILKDKFKILTLLNTTNESKQNEQQELIKTIRDILYRYLEPTTVQLELYAEQKAFFSNTISSLDTEVSTLKAKVKEMSKNHNDTNIFISQLHHDLMSSHEECDHMRLELSDSKKKNQEIATKLLSIESTPIRKVYSDATSKYSKLEEKNKTYFFRGIILFLIVTIGLFFCKSWVISLLGNQEHNSIIEFWVLKISIMLIGITLLSYFLKQASHYQKLADQNHQTEVELQAYPHFMNSISPEISTEVKKELALKYFGREIDGSAHKDMSNLISNQMKNTTELVKATTDAVKSLTIKHQGPS